MAYLASLISLFILLFSTANAQQIPSASLIFSRDSHMSDNALEEEVVSYAEDSIAYDLINKRVHLYHNAKVTYGEIILTAAYIELDSDKNTVYATWLKDSIGQVYGLPEFQENGKALQQTLLPTILNQKGNHKRSCDKRRRRILLGKKSEKTI